MLDKLITLLAGELSGERCMTGVQTIARHHRIQASPGYRAAAQDCLQTLAGSGVPAHITTYPATGRTRAWTHMTPQEWACDDAELWLLDEQSQRRERLAWFEAVNLSLIQRSCATSREGVTAELCVVDEAEEAAAWEGQDLAGKIVLVGNGDIHQMLHHAQKAGAIGLITARMTYHPPVRPRGDLADALQYTSFWWAPEETKGWGFVVSTGKGAELRHLARTGKVRLWARVDSRFYDGTIENVEAVIPGETAEEVLVISHLCHPRPSANDNATGPATGMEVARTLTRLIADGRLAKPRRTIRFLFPPEMTGTYEHLAALTPEARSRIVAALNVDMVGQRQEITGSVLLCEYPPMACPSFAGDLLSLVLAGVAADVTPFGGGSRYALFRHAVTAFSGGSDHYIMADPTVGVPCPMIIQWPDRFYHTSADTPEKVDPNMMRLVGTMTGAYAYFLAVAGLAETIWLAAEMTALFPRQLHEAIRPGVDPEAMAGFRVDRKLADLGSLRRLTPTSEHGAFERVLQACANQVKVVAELELQRVALTASPHAAAVASGEAGALTPGWTGPADLHQVRPVRVYPGPVSLREYLTELPESESTAWRDFTLAQKASPNLAEYLCYWADGQRTLAEICRLAQLESGMRNDTWALGYFQLLARLGVAKGV